MTEITINGVPVSFPFKPYDVQVAYMEKVIDCLEKGGNGVLESPTGTGKTLSLLCASCGWLIQKKAQLQARLQPHMFELLDGDFVTGLQSGLNTTGRTQPGAAVNEKSALFCTPKIIYASRTHSQLTQAIQELKRTRYNHVKVAVLGSRDQMCIHPDVSKETSNSMKVMMCRAKVNSRTCHLYNNVEKKKDELTIQTGILDIEDLVKVGRKLQCCPYYAAREIQANADVTFLPYNYLLDPRTRKALGIELMDSVIILDEAHNIEKMCEESASMAFSNADIALCIDEVTQVMNDINKETPTATDFFDDGNSAMKDFSINDLCLLKIIFLELEEEVSKIKDGSTFPGNYMIELLAKAKLTSEKKTLVMDTLSNVILYLSTTTESQFLRKGTALQKFSDLLAVVFRYDNTSGEFVNKIKQTYKVHISVDEAANKKKVDPWSTNKLAARVRVVNYWCFSPQFGMELLLNQGVRSVVLTSGTLAPLKPFISELGIPVSVQLENPHIVGPNQVCVAVVKNGPDGCQLNSSFKTRDDPRYMASLARTILNLSRIIPDGVLVFFPSYHFLRKCQEEWQSEGMWSKIAAIKPIFVESRSKDDFSSTMDGYYSQIQDPESKGACFMAVTRGKVSEGLDFADCNGRAVIITGLPYPPFKDPRVVLKQQYLQEIQTKEKKSLSGNEWYQLEATRAVNQAVGRVIRHAKDYGVILLCDSRFDNPNIKQQLSAWLRPHIKTYTEFGTLTRNIKEFFRAAEKNLPNPKRKAGVFSGSELRLEPVPAYFDTSSSSFRHSQSKSSTNSTNNSTEATSHWTPEDYSIAVTKSTTSLTNSTEKTVEGLFGALDTSRSSVIDFNDTLDGTGLIKTEKISIPLPTEPVVKRPRLKIPPMHLAPLVEFDLFDQGPKTTLLSSYRVSSRQNSTAPFPVRSVGSAPIKTLLPSYRLSSRRPDSTTQKLAGKEEESNSSNSSTSNTTAQSTEMKKDLSKIEIPAYLKELKKTLSPDSYKKFTAVIAHYTKNSDYEYLIEVLREIFISQNLYTLLQGFRHFIKKEHKETFKELCDSVIEKL